MIYNEYGTPETTDEVDQKYYKRGLDVRTVEDIFRDSAPLPNDLWSILVSNPTYDNISEAIQMYPSFSRELNCETIWHRLYLRDFGPVYTDEEVALIKKGDRTESFHGWKSAYVYRMMMRKKVLNNNPKYTLVNGRNHVVDPGSVRNTHLVKGTHMLLMHWDNKILAVECVDERKFVRHVWEGMFPARDVVSSTPENTEETLFWGTFPSTTIISMYSDDVNKKVYVAAQNQGGTLGIIETDLITGKIEKYYEAVDIQPLLNDMVEMCLYGDYVLLATQGILHFWNIRTLNYDPRMRCTVYEDLVTDRIICIKYLGGDRFVLASVVNGDTIYEVCIYDVKLKRKIKKMCTEPMGIPQDCAMLDSTEYDKVIAVARESVAFTTPSGRLVIFDGFDATYTMYHDLQLYEPHHIVYKPNGCKTPRYRCDIPQVVELNTFLFGTAGWKSKSKVAMIVYADGGCAAHVKQISTNHGSTIIKPCKITGDVSKFVLSDNIIKGCPGNVQPYLMYMDWGKLGGCGEMS